jgi:hypothetical protein
MTVTADHVSLPLDTPDVDQRLGSTDVTWAERAYHNEARESANGRRQVPRSHRPGMRILAAVAIVCLMVALVLAMRLQVSSPSPVTHRPTSSQTVTAPRTTILGSPFTRTLPTISSFPSLFPVVDTP